MFLDKEIDAFAANNFRIDSHHITLSQRGVAEDPILLSGSGYIIQSGNRFSFQVYVSSFSHQQNDIMRLEWGNAPGKIIPEKSYFDLQLITYNGERWKAERVLPQGGWHENGTLLKGNVNTLRKDTGETFPAGYMEMHFFTPLDLPWTKYSEYKDSRYTTNVLDRHIFNLMGVNIDIVSADKRTIIRVDGPTAVDFEMRFIESLRFILARSVSYDVVVQGHQTASSVTFYSDPLLSRSRSMRPPIARGSDAWHDTWTLFESFFVHISTNTRSGLYSVISYHLSQVREATSGNLESLAVAACIAVEGLSYLLEAPAKRADEDELKGLRDGLIKSVADNPTWAPFVERIRGLLSQLFNKTVRDLLASPARKGMLNPEHAKRWSQVRNRSVHPKAKDLSFVPRSAQEQFDDAFAMCVLLYVIIFNIIGYRGRFSDFSIGYSPTRQLPVSDWAEVPALSGPAAKA